MTNKMRILVDIGHPAHVHLFRVLLSRVQIEGGNVLATTREKEVTVQLCRAYGIPQLVLSRKRKGMIGNVIEYFERTWKLWRVARTFEPDILLGTSVSIGPVGRLIGKPSVVFQEDDQVIVPSFARLAYPLSSYIATPACLAYENHGEKHLIYQGYHELAYLHPDNFTSDPQIRPLLGLSSDDAYFILRFVSMEAHHDTAIRGFDFEIVNQLVTYLSNHGKLFISSEKGLHDSFAPYRFPLQANKLVDALAQADMVIGDSQTVAAEAAVLGVPNIRYNSFVGRLSYLNELEQKYGLTKGFLPHESEKLLETVIAWLSNLQQVKTELHDRRQKMLSESVNLAEWQWKILTKICSSQPVR
jgi:uncharacterized protein